MSGSAPPGTGYFVAPPSSTTANSGPSNSGPSSSGPSNSGHGVLLLHSAWGLTTQAKERANELADVGYSVLVPDLNDGIVASTANEATEYLLAADMNVTASLVLSSMRLLRQATPVPNDPIAVVGFGSGTSWGLWLSVRQPDACQAVVGYSGTQTIAFDGSRSNYLIHLGTNDDVVTSDDAAHLGLSLQLANRPMRFEWHHGCEHAFDERASASWSAAADAVAWRQTLEFLAENHLPGSTSN